MAAVDSAYASWLQADAFFRNWTNTGLPAGLNPMSRDSEAISPFAAVAACDTELTRQQAIFGGALAMDVVTIKGRRNDLVGKCIGVTGDQLNYGATPTVLVIGAAEQDDGTTNLTVIRKL